MGKFQLDIVQFLIYFGALNGLILFLLLFASAKNRKATKWLSLLILALAFNYLNYTLVHNLYTNLSWFTLIRVPVLYSFGFLLWFYVSFLTNPSFKLGRKEKLYLIPFWLDVAYSFGTALYISYFALEQKQELQYDHVEFLIHEGLAIVYNFLFVVRSYQRVFRHNLQMKNQLSAIQQVDLGWLRGLLLALIVLWVLWIGHYAVELWLYPDYLSFQDYYPLWTLIIVAILAIGYKSLLQSDLALALPETDINVSKEKYKTSHLKHEELSLYGNRLQQAVESDKLYLQQELSLNDLAEQTGWSVHDLSRIINQGLQSNFYDFINSYRVFEVQRLIADQNFGRESLLSLAFRAGFNSKTAFNTAFKKILKMSPSEYRKSLIQ